LVGRVGCGRDGCGGWWGGCDEWVWFDGCKGGALDDPQKVYWNLPRYHCAKKPDGMTSEGFEPPTYRFFVVSNRGRPGLRARDTRNERLRGDAGVLINTTHRFRCFTSPQPIKQHHISIPCPQRATYREQIASASMHPDPQNRSCRIRPRSSSRPPSAARSASSPTEH